MTMEVHMKYLQIKYTASVVELSLVLILWIIVPFIIQARELPENQVRTAVETWVRYIAADARPEAVIARMEPYQADGTTVAYIAHIVGGGFCLCGADDSLLPVYLYSPAGSYRAENPNYQYILWEMKTRLIGLSIDQVFSHIKWTEWIKENLNTVIPFPIIADHGAIGKRLGMIHPGKGPNTVRAVFIVDSNGIIRLILFYPQEIGRNMDEIVRAVKALQLADREKVAIPANWPNNELIGDHVIIPPPKDVKTAEERLKSQEFECYDWWLCHKKLED